MSYDNGELNFDLVSVHSEQENSFIKNLTMAQSWYKEKNLEPSDKRFPWIGLRKSPRAFWNDTENVRWVDDSPFVYNKWAAGEPNSKV